MKVYEVIPRKLYQSGRTAQLNDADCRRLIEDRGITGVVNLWHTADPRVKALVPTYIHHSVPDGLLKAPNKFVEIAALVVSVIAMGGCVLVHCWGGRNRSGLVCGLALRTLENLSGEAAYCRIKATRPGALSNVHFATYLRGAE